LSKIREKAVHMFHTTLLDRHFKSNLSFISDEKLKSAEHESSITIFLACSEQANEETRKECVNTPHWNVLFQDNYTGICFSPISCQ